MAQIPEEGPNGERAESVTLVLGEDMVLRCEEYSVSCAIIQQPATFSLRLSAGKYLAGDVIRNYPPGSTFALEVAGRRQFVGRVDGWTANGPGGSTSIELKGRDLLAALHDNDVSAEQSFTNVTYGELVKAAMKECGVENFPLVVSNDENRIIKSGVGVTTEGGAGSAPKAPPTRTVTQTRTRTGREAGILPLRDRAIDALGFRYTKGGEVTADIKEILTDETTITIKGRAQERVAAGSGLGVKHVVHAKLGESWLDFVMRHLAKVGLFLFTGHDGSFILATPAKNQKPSSLFVRQRGQRSNVCNVTDAKWTNDTTHRLSEVVIYARGLGRKHSRSKVHGGFVDEEMLALGLKKEKVFRDVNVTNAEQAEFYARRMIAEANRNAWRLTYTFSGHTAPTMVSGDRAIPVPDSVARVEDDELGIHEDLYIESVSFSSPPRTTTVTMMRLQDLVFEDDVDRSDKTKPKQTYKGTDPKEVANIDPIDLFGLRYGTAGVVGIKTPGTVSTFSNSARPLPTANKKLR